MLLEGRHKVTRASDQQELAQAFESGKGCHDRHPLSQKDYEKIKSLSVRVEV